MGVRWRCHRCHTFRVQSRMDECKRICGRMLNFSSDRRTRNHVLILDLQDHVLGEYHHATSSLSQTLGRMQSTGTKPCVAKRSRQYSGHCSFR